MEVFVFKTNINGMHNIEKLKTYFNNREEILRWSVDMQDIDKVLRVEAASTNPTEIINLVQTAGFECEELPD
jgi:hypothetical protein